MDDDYSGSMYMMPNETPHIAWQTNLEHRKKLKNKNRSEIRLFQALNVHLLRSSRLRS
jgi:hypothetical protein